MRLVQDIERQLIEPPHALIGPGTHPPHSDDDSKRYTELHGTSPPTNLSSVVSKGHERIGLRRAARWDIRSQQPTTAIRATIALLNTKRDGDRLRVRALVDRVEVVDLERAADLVAGQVLEDVEREQLVSAGPPGSRRA